MWSKVFSWCIHTLVYWLIPACFCRLPSENMLEELIYPYFFLDPFVSSRITCIKSLKLSFSKFSSSCNWLLAKNIVCCSFVVWDDSATTSPWFADLQNLPWSWWEMQPCSSIELKFNVNVMSTSDLMDYWQPFSFYYSYRNLGFLKVLMSKGFHSTDYLSPSNWWNDIGLTCPEDMKKSQSECSAETLKPMGAIWMSWFLFFWSICFFWTSFKLLNPIKCLVRTPVQLRPQCLIWRCFAPCIAGVRTCWFLMILPCIALFKDAIKCKVIVTIRAQMVSILYEAYSDTDWTQAAGRQVVNVA